ncbi:DUF2868 domain-containing protein [Halioxenophilus aromaticivorans]|uniref:DUF2868 domain-containing protein n=1 Tax=Halioxenophilus aromaticivorans TaxID=1306992 RepID=A0AAV3U4Q2_9ALTE
MKKPVGPRWTLSHLLQFEQYLKLDEQTDSAAQAQRDRSVFQRLPANQHTRPRAYLAWLAQRVNQSPLAVDAGALFNRAYGGTLWMLLLIGFFMGAAMSYGALYYDGTVPVNVAIFLALLVLPQLLMLVLLVLSVLLSLLAGRWFSAWYRPAAKLMQTLLAASWRRLVARPGGAQQDQQQLQQELLQQTLGLHGPLFANRALRLFQVVGVAFNLGALACFVLLLAVTDRAFGWQSSLTDSPALVEQIVSGLAWPWREWLGAGVGYPSLAQIEQSRIVLAAQSSIPQAAAWWPFLLLCVVFYGLLPRIAVYLFAALREHWLLSRLSFDTFHYQELWRRMQSIQLHSFGHASPHTAEASTVHTPITAQQTISANAYVLQDTLARYRQADLIHWLPFASSEQQLLIIDAFSDIAPAAGKPIYVVVEGWQPPIEEVLLALVDAAKRAAEQHSDLHILLLGKPGKVGNKPISPRMAEVWRKKLDLHQQANILVHADSAQGSES